MNHQCFLGIGSNISAPEHIHAGLDELMTVGCIERVSRVYRSAAVGFDGDPFLNCAVEVTTALQLPALIANLRAIEFRYGRTEDCDKFSSRTLDIDLLTFDRIHGPAHGIVLPRDETTRNAFVLGPFAEIAPHLVLPGQSSDLASLWSNYDATQQPLTPVPFTWHDQQLPYLRATDTRAVVTMESR